MSYRLLLGSVHRFGSSVFCRVNRLGGRIFHCTCGGTRSSCTGILSGTSEVFTTGHSSSARAFGSVNGTSDCGTTSSLSRIDSATSSSFGSIRGGTDSTSSSTSRTGGGIGHGFGHFNLRHANFGSFNFWCVFTASHEASGYDCNEENRLIHVTFLGKNLIKNFIGFANLNQL